MPLSAGDRVDRYEVIGFLGSGGMGEVYCARDPRLQRQIALKILRGDGPLATEGRQRLLREARAVAALSHPNVLSVFDVGEVSEPESLRGLAYIAMELVVGKSLRAFFGDEALPLERRLQMLVEIAGALVAAHDAGLVHRDVKPENVMVRFDGAVKVLDFGIARSVGPVDALSSTEAHSLPTLRTETPNPLANTRASQSPPSAPGSIAGTLYYMAPEQLRGESVDGRADQFAWGVVAYELLTGKAPWSLGSDPIAIVSQILSHAPRPPAEIAPDISSAVSDAILRTLAKDAAQRFPSMRALVASLGSTHPLPSRSPPRPQPAPAPPKRPRRWAAVAAIALAVSIAGLAGLARRARPVAPSAPDAASPAATTLLDLPLPTTNPEALAAYKEAIGAMRRGGEWRRLRRAVDLDPALSPALLRLARRVFYADLTEARELFQRALQARASLTARDQELLDAFEPLFEKDPPDEVESRRRLEALTRRYPRDAELAYELAWLEEQMGAYEAALPEYDRAVALDPGYGWALIGKADVLLLEGNTVAAVAVAAECERVSPGESTCIMDRALIEHQEGRCAALEEDARKIIMLSPKWPHGYLRLAQALASLGGSQGAVREAISQVEAWSSGGEMTLPENQVLDIDALVLAGSFAGARDLVLARESAPAVKANDQESVHATMAWARVQIAIETGNDAEASDLAADFRARRRAWSLPAGEDQVGADPWLRMLALLVREHRAPREELDAAREALTKLVSDPRDPTVWVTAYAWTATTADEAKLALDALPRFAPLYSFWDFPAELGIGRTFFLAGRVDEALPHLTRAANACDALDNPFDHVRASLLLGQALEAKNDVAGACESYGRVVRQWGDATPRSVTANAARARIRALKCASP